MKKIDEIKPMGLVETPASIGFGGILDLVVLKGIIHVGVDGMPFTLDDIEERPDDFILEISKAVIGRIEEKTNKTHPVRERIKRSTIISVFLRDGEKCKKCGSVKREDLQIDHIIPISKGGNNDLENLQILCSKCNLRKGAK